MKTTGSIILNIMALASLGLIPSAAMASSTKDRTGFNFGTSIRILDDQSNSNATDSNSVATKSNNSGQAFSPYVAYAFGPINLGLVFNIENDTNSFTQTDIKTNAPLSHSTVTSTRAGSLFSRFNFGQIMYLEAGGGIYSQTTTTHTEQQSASSGSFSGTAQDQTQAGMGPGYHAGAGLELSAGSGYFFTAAYMVHSYTLHDTSNNSYGGSIGTQQKSELSFGIAYYNK